MSYVVVRVAMNQLIQAALLVLIAEDIGVTSKTHKFCDRVYTVTNVGQYDQYFAW